MKHVLIWLATALTLVSISVWAAVPTPVVTGNILNWPAVDANTINVHTGDGSYIESLPGHTTSWAAPAPGQYYLIAADEREWPDWPRSETVTVEQVTTSAAPIPVVDGLTLNWPLVLALGINIHQADGTYIDTLPGTATAWSTSQAGEYYLVAANDGDWSTWPRSETVTLIDDSGVSAVTGLRAEIYSGTAAEIFWERTEQSGNRYQVSANGDEVANTDGRSWFCDCFTMGSTTVLSVVVIDSNGNESAPTSLTVTTATDRPAVSSPTINRDNYEHLLTDVFSAYFGLPYTDPLLDLTDNLLGSIISAASPFEEPYSCVNGGEATFEGPFRIQFENCRIGNAVYMGDFHIGDRNISIGSRSLAVITDMDSEINFEGNIDGPRNTGYFRPFDVNVSVNTPTGKLRLENANHQYAFTHLLRCCNSSRNFISEYHGSFDLSSPNTGNQLVSVKTLTNFYYSQPFPEPAEWHHRSGILSISAADGSRLILNADTGKDDTVSIQLINNTELEEFSQSWSTRWSVWQQIIPR